MFPYFKINIINLILWLSMTELHFTVINGHFKATASSSINHKIKQFYIKSSNTTSINHNTKPYYANKEVKHEVATHLEETIPTANAIDNNTQYITPTVGGDTKEKLLQNTLFKLKTKNEEHICLLDSLKLALLWWSYNNGTLKKTNLNILSQHQQLDLSYRNISSDEEVLIIISNISEHMGTVAFSLAYNDLKAVPFRTLQMMEYSLKYLSLMGNPFNGMKTKKLFKNRGGKRMFAYNREDVAWATFPDMPALQELDISDCSIEFIDKTAFQNLTNLKSLYMAHNKILTIPSDTFKFLSSLQILDLSFTKIYDLFMNYTIAFPNLESVSNIIYGVNIEQHVFRYLPNLVYLDLSHSKLSRSSVMAFTHIGNNLKYLSLCYTSFPMFGNGILRNSSLIGLDLSGNANAAFSLTEHVFKGLSESLTYLYFERANVRDLSWLKPLHKLRFLALAGNIINTLSAKHFSHLKELQILDLSSNQVGNWYSQVFVHNHNLRVLGLRDNNINILTSEMLKDFSMLVYLGLGYNNFICDCLLRDLVDIAAINNQQAKCREHFWQDLKNEIHINSTHLAHILHNSQLFFNTSLASLDIPSLVVYQNLQKLKQSVKFSHQTKSMPKLHYILNGLRNYNKSKACLNHNNSSNSYNERINSSLFKLQLLDYEEEQYWCYNETSRQNVIGLNCERSTLIEDIDQALNTLTTYIMSSVGSLILVAALGAFIYCKRWHIYYFYSSLKSSALLSVISKDNLNKFNSLSVKNPNMIYDIFISYCQSDRDWIVNELVPNVESAGDISICLHERDFQVGLTIIDNIVSCMERSKILMLIISSNFLLSHWCQFEMQLAQNHIFDLSKDHLILVLLEDIPRCKRPKNLQFLMNIKTYIKWPGSKCRRDVHLEECKLFWKRLKLTLKNIGVTSLEFKA